MVALLLRGSEISVFNKNEFLMRQVNPFVQPQEFFFGILAQNYFTDSNISRHRGILNNDAGMLRKETLWISQVPGWSRQFK